MVETDDQLWVRCGEGDASALGELYRRHANSIYRHAFRATADWSRAEDITSLVFIEAWNGRNRTVEIGMVLAWLHGIAINIMRNESRARRRHRSVVERVASQVPDVIHDQSETACRLDDQTRARTVLNLVRELPTEQREVIALCWWAELSYEEAATALNIPIGTVRSRVSRARASLKTALQDNQLPLPHGVHDA
jgi:RNA polymerase sigma-70 factor (ECF subfamily)